MKDKYKYLRESRIATDIRRVKTQYPVESQAKMLRKKLGLSPEQIELALSFDKEEKNLKKKLFDFGSINEEFKYTPIYEAEYSLYSFFYGAKYYGFAITVILIVLFILTITDTLHIFSSGSVGKALIYVYIMIGVNALFLGLDGILAYRLPNIKKLKKDTLLSVTGKVTACDIFYPALRGNALASPFVNLTVFDENNKKYNIKYVVPVAVNLEASPYVTAKKMLEMFGDNKIEFQYFSKHKYVIDASVDLEKMFFDANQKHKDISVL